MSCQFLPANQAQIIRSNQRDLFHIGALREKMESLLQMCFGTRWILRWDKELELFSKLAYFGLSTAHASQTLGEEYTDVWQQSSQMQTIMSRKARSVLTLLSILPPYLISRMIPRLGVLYPDSQAVALLRRLPLMLEVISEANLTVFYLFGIYYDLTKRLFRIRHISSVPQNPNVTPPSYSLLGIMLSIRLLYRLFTSLRFLSSFGGSDATKVSGQRSVQHTPSDEPKLDARAISFVLEAKSMAEQDPVPAEEDENTLLDIITLSPDARSGRRCTLCLEERTSTCVTECGHLFCWACVMNWGREKPECPLCRQSLNLTRLLPVYNL